MGNLTTRINIKFNLFRASSLLTLILFSLFSFRYIMVVKVSDASGEAFISVFNEEAEKIVGCSADELDKLKSEVSH